eukprot:jgi/Phyca11/132547/e_gw1.180.17.1
MKWPTGIYTNHNTGHYKYLHEALTDWTKLRRNYKNKLRARCRVTGENYDNIVQSIRDSMDPDLLDGLCELRLNEDAANVTADMLIADIALTLSSVSNTMLPDVKALFKPKLRMDLTESDVDVRVLDYSNQLRKLVRENGLGTCFEGTGLTRQSASNSWPLFTQRPRRKKWGSVCRIRTSRPTRL